MGNEMLMPFIRDCYANHKPLGPIHRKAMEMFRLYMLLGGMPQVLQTYIETRDFRRTETVKQNILSLYRDDIRKYATGAEARAAAVFEAVPSQLQKHGTRFMLSDISENARYVNYESSFFWLRDSRIVNICYNTFAPNIGLGMNTERTTLKCYMADTGLFLSLAFDEHGQMPADIYERILHGKLEVNLGYVMENIVAQMLVAAGRNLYYFYQYDDANAANTIEIDFLISKPTITARKNICPIEVKSSPRYSLSSLNKCINKFGQYITNPIVLHTKDVEIKDGITFLPLYMAGLL
jgi:predicted AAA+ superfamily ATPase